MKDFFKKLFDSGDRSVETHLVLVSAGACVFLALALYHTLVLHSDFDPEHYGTGFGSLLAGGGAASWGQGLQRKAQNDSAKEDGDEPTQ